MRSKHSLNLFGSFSILWGVCSSMSAAGGATDKTVRDSVAQIVSQIQRADYEGSQPAMQKGYDALAQFLENADIAARVRYWRGFAMWRKAVNGFNDKVDPGELEQDLKQALDEFKQAITKDPSFV